MSGNAQKTPFGLSVNRHATAVALDQIEKTGRALPCIVTKVMGAIVQVSFQITGNSTIPSVVCAIATSQYTREPIQPGCKGSVVPHDAYLGGVTGLGGGVAGLTQPANLSALVFHPVGNTDFPATDPNTYTITGGSNGVKIQDATGANLLTINSGTITLNATAVLSQTTKFVIQSLPSAPGVAGQLWRNGTTVMVS
jgi:hypothetical protein